MNLVIDPTLLDTLVAHAERDYPEECCGILVGVRRGLDRIIHRAVPSNNITEGDRRRNYQVDWEMLLRTQRQARADQREIIGFYHSHPDGSAQPSQRDLDHAWSDCSYLILAMFAGRYVDSASWRTDDRRRTFEFEPFAPPGRATPACADVADRIAGSITVRDSG
ncbi:MAG: M67 family metallopeptidase [Phycisphaerales bacterium]|nr:M67 family metallopeptidase [Phycisphaerales bacterium]